MIDSRSDVIGSMSVVFYLFKQKTAYDMRISDWSSDVCSSDLFVGGVVGLQAGGQAPAQAEGAAEFCDHADFLRHQHQILHAHDLRHGGDHFRGQEIGRASWRE